ncbi:hypothetical protein U0070_022001, partial [Myodes glareolus]
MALPLQLSFVPYVSAFALDFPLNLLAIRGAVVHARPRLTPSLVYVLHLSCSDLLLAITLPLKAVEALASGVWPLPLPFCPVFVVAHFAPLYAGGSFLAALSAGRYLGAAFSLWYQAIRRPHSSWGMCVAIWALVLCHLGLVFGLEAPGGWLNNTTSSLGINIAVNGSPVCLEAWDPNSARPARLSFSILLFFLPLVITAFCYVGCLRALTHSGLSHKRKLRAAWVAGGALLTLLLYLGPYNASNVASFINPDLGGSWRKLGLITGAWSVVLNPLVTGYLGTGPGRGTSNKERDLESHFPVVNKKDAGCKLWSAEGMPWVVLPLKAPTNMAVSLSPANHWLFFSVYLFVFLVGLPLNLMALVVFVGKLRRRPVAVDLLLVNLTLSDLLLLLFLPFRMVEAACGMRWLLPFILCPLSGFLYFTTIYLTSLFLTAVSIERFLSVAYPLWYKTRPR